MGKKTVFFDRDGTLIIDKIYLNDPDQIEYLPGAFDALRLLRDHGFEFIIVTNQSGVARGLVSIENLNEIHRRMTDEFARHGVFFAGIYYAPFSVESNHIMRKPNPGMLSAAAHDHGINLSQSWIVGDRATDIQAGHSAGCRGVLLGNTESPSSVESCRPDVLAQNLMECAYAIINFKNQLVESDMDSIKIPSGNLPGGRFEMSQN